MAATDNIIQALMAVLTGGASIPTGMAARPPSVAAPAAAVPVPVPVQQTRPATLPGGSFVPARTAAKTMPDGTVVEDQDAAAPPILPPPPAAAPQHTSLLEQLFGGGGGDGHGMRDFIRAAGAGMANGGNTGGDPYLAFGRGFGGATGYRDDQDHIADATATANEKLAYDRSQDAGKTQREIEKDRADMALKSLAEQRQQKTADLTNQKTALEIRREARQNGITTTQMLEIERIAQAAGENLYNEDRTKAIDETRKRLLEQVASGDSGLSGGDQGAGLSGSSDITATGPNGERVKLVDGAWVPM